MLKPELTEFVAGDPFEVCPILSAYNTEFTCTDNDKQ